MLAVANSDLLAWEAPIGEPPKSYGLLIGVRGFLFLTATAAVAASAAAGAATLLLDDGANRKEHDCSHDQNHDNVSQGIHLLSS